MKTPATFARLLAIGCILLLAATALFTTCDGGDAAKDPKVAAAVGNGAAAAASPAAVAPEVAALEARFGKNALVPDPGRHRPPKDAPDQSVMRRWWGDRVRSLNVYLQNDGGTVDSLLVYVMHDFAPRWRLDPDRYAPGVADYASASDDAKSVTVHLRSGIHWQFPAVDRDDPKHAWLVDLFAKNPPELTAEDVAFTHAAILDPELDPAGYAAAYAGSKIELLDRFTYRMTFERPTSRALSLATSFDEILAKFLYGRSEDGRELAGAELSAALKSPWYRLVCGYGPYEFVRYDPNVEIVVRRKDDFPLCHPPIREIRWQIIVDPEQTVLRLKAGELDHTVLGAAQLKRYWIDAPDGSDFKGGGKFDVQRYEKMEYSYLGWNNRKPPFDDVRVRRAMATAFHREAFLKECFQGFGALVDSHVWHANPDHDPNLAPLVFDLDAASRLLDEAGWKDSDGDGVRDKLVKDKDGTERKRDFAFTFKSIADVPEYANALALYRDDLKRIGVDMNLVAMPYTALAKQVYEERDFDAFLGNLALAWDTDFLPIFHSSQATDGLNYVGYSNPECDALIEQHRECLDPQKRRKLSFAIQQILWRDQPFTFFLRRDRVSVYTNRLKNVEYAIARPQLVSFDWYLAPE